MNPSVKNFLLIVAKNAVNALITNATLMATLPGVFNAHTVDGWINLGKAAGAAIIAREVTVWGPILLKWSTTDANPN